jgi:hypothetical protein
MDDALSLIGQQRQYMDTAGAGRVHGPRRPVDDARGSSGMRSPLEPVLETPGA